MKLHHYLFSIILAIPFLVLSQETDDANAPEEILLERDAFESAALIENQTNVLNSKGTLEMVMNHRFGVVNAGSESNDLIGLWGPANIRIALTYALHDRITVGAGTTKDSRLQDFSLKGAILRQTRKNEMPVSLTYYGNFTVDARRKENFEYTEDRYSYFNQLIIARRFSRNLSFQIAPSLSHFNLVKSNMQNDMFAVALGGRAKITPTIAVLADYSQPITSFTTGTPDPGVSIGLEFSTGSHAFQVFITNYKGIVQQQNYMFNQNNFFSGDFLIGFNITRLWHL